MAKKIGKAGNQGAGVKSDCHVEFEITPNGGIIVEINSKVKALYGRKCRIDVLFFQS